MDFGNILDEWQRRGKGSIPNKDAQLEKTPSPAEIRRRLLKKRPDATIDLHGLTRDEAWISLEEFFKNAERENFEKLMIIHGKGNHTGGESAIKLMVRNFLERSPIAGQSGQCKANEGGSGATWVLIKQIKNQTHST